MYDIDVYSDSYTICNKEYGYDYFRLSFLEVAEKLTDDDEYEIVTRMVRVFKGYMEEREKRADDVMAANLGEGICSS